MATLSHAESRRLYSWWWDSHISPKNSKWLQENLADMDANVKSMIKLIEEDADSFRKRAEMYYRKRPELMKLVEEFYRAYRALAERYDHATGALRQAHRTMAEAFPDQIPMMLPDESPSGSSAADAEPHTPKFLCGHALFDSNDSSPVKRNGIPFEETDEILVKERPRQLHEMVPADEETPEKFVNGRARKGLNFDKGLLEDERQKLESRISQESERACKAESELDSLKNSVLKLESEKEVVALQNQLSQERISKLESDISRMQEEFRKLNGEMLSGITKLKTAEDQCHLLEKKNESLQSELNLFKERAEELQEELNMKQDELQKLSLSVKDEHDRYVQAEMARKFLEELHAQSREEVRLLALEIEKWAEKLEHAQRDKVSLEDEIRRLKEEILGLNEQYSSCSLKILNLQHEIKLLEESKWKLEDEVKMLLGEKKALQEEVSSLKNDKKDSGKRHNALTEQIGAVHVNVESLQILVKELRDGNLELKDLCKKHEDERSLHLESLKYLEKVTEQNTVLQNSLTKANAELEELKEKVMALEESCKTLHGKISMHMSEKSLLVRQVEAVARNMEMLSEKNAQLESSHSDVNLELEGLRGMLNASEQVCESLCAQISCLIDEKSTLVNKVESIGYCLENLESRFTALDDKKLNLEREKDHALDQVTQLQHSFQLQKEENETIKQSRKSQLANLEKQISILEGNVYVREEELEMECHKVIHDQIEIFILQRCLFDMREKYLTLSDKCREYVKTLKREEETISKLEQEISMHKKRLTLMSGYNEKLVEGIHQVMRMLDISNKCQPQGDQIFSLVLLKIEELKSSILDVQDGSHRLVLEKSVILSFLKQFALSAAELASQKDFVEQESEKRFWELSVLQSGRDQLLVLNELLRNNVEACKQREEVLLCESDILHQQLSDLQEAYSRSQSEISKLIDSGKLFSKKNNDLIEENDALEEENSALVAEAMKLEHLYCFFKSLSVERASDLQLLNYNMYQLLEINSILGQEIRSQNENLRAAEVENARLKDLLVTLEECRGQLVILENEVKTTRNTCEQQNVQIEVGKNILVEKDMELLVEHEKFQTVQDKNTELNGIIQSVTMNLDVSKEAKEELEKKNVTLLGLNTNINNQIAVLHQANDALKLQLRKLLEEMDELKYRERHLTSELQNRTEEVSSCEAEIEALLNDIQITTVNLSIFEEKMSELLIKCESLEVGAIMQKEMLHDEITKRTVFEKNLKEELDAMDAENRSLKEELSAYVPLVLTVQDRVTSLGGHILSLAKHHLSNQEQEDNRHSLQQNCSEERNEVCSATPPFGIFALQKLLAKVSALEKVVIDIQGCSEQSKFIPHSSLQSAKKEAEGLKLKGTACIEELPIAKDIILHLKKREESGNTRKANAEISTEQIMKDIQLDHILTTSNYENGSTSRPPSVTCSDEVRDQMMELWETIDANKLKPSPMSSEHETECHQVEAIEEEKSKYKQVTDKELSTDKLVNQERTESIREMLSSDAERLSLLQKSVMELNMIMENSELNRSPTSFEFKKVKAQLEEAEDAILQFIETNKKLTKKAEKISSLYNSPIDGTDLENSSERRLSDRVRRVSEKIGRLELELQKLEYIWLKLREEHDYRMARAANRRTRVLLKDYLYGRRESPRRRKVHCCACMRPRTKDD